MNSSVVELVVFKVKPGLSEEAVREAVDKTMPFLRRFKGFQRRELSVTPNGEWVDILHWADMESAQQAMQAFMDAPECKDFMNVFDGPPSTVLHSNSVMTYTTGAANE